MLESLIRTHLQRYPDMQIQDVYKLVFQATFGVGYPVLKRENEKDWLEHQWSIATPQPKELLIEPVSPDEKWVRFHLRPYIAAGGRLEALLDAFIRSSQIKKGSPAEMEQNWAIVERMMPFPQEKLKLFGKAQRENMWSAVQHSPQFFRAYDPLYRVLTMEEARKLSG